MTTRRCTACGAPGVTRAHGICPDCLAAAHVADCAAQGIDPYLPADSPLFARFDAATRPLALWHELAIPSTRALPGSIPQPPVTS